MQAEIDVIKSTHRTQLQRLAESEEALRGEVFSLQDEGSALRTELQALQAT